MRWRLSLWTYTSSHLSCRSKKCRARARHSCTLRALLRKILLSIPVSSFTLSLAQQNLRRAWKLQRRNSCISHRFPFLHCTNAMLRTSIIYPIRAIASTCWNGRKQRACVPCFPTKWFRQWFGLTEPCRAQFPCLAFRRFSRSIANMCH